jgi:NAD(P)-dependent dehydrogenase (short-subunit alcohol dehydrogenase family)
MEIAGTAALVTGGASGLGLATTERLVTAGAHVTIIDLPTSHGKDIAHRLGDAVTFAPADVTDPAAVAAALAGIADRGRDLRIVVNCAGIGTPAKVVGRKGPFPLELFRKTVEVNLIGTFNVIRLAAEHMLKEDLADDEERGVIVNTASVAAFEGQIGQAAYSASKGGIVGMTLPIARELAEGQIRVSTIAPGLFETPLLAELPEEVRQSLGAQVPHPKRLGMPAEFARLVESIITNPMLNGETIRLDGSIRMAPR